MERIHWRFCVKSFQNKDEKQTKTNTGCVYTPRFINKGTEVILLITSLHFSFNRL